MLSISEPGKKDIMERELSFWGSSPCKPSPREWTLWGVQADRAAANAAKEVGTEMSDAGSIQHILLAVGSERRGESGMRLRDSARCSAGRKSLCGHATAPWLHSSSAAFSMKDQVRHGYERSPSHIQGSYISRIH